MYKLKEKSDRTTKAAREAEEHEKSLAAHFLRTEPLGYDRYRNAYWRFEGDTKLYVQVFASRGPTNHCLDIDPRYLSLYTSRPSGVSSTWRIYASMWELWALVDALDDRGIREQDLKTKLKACFGLSGNTEGFLTTGNQFIGRKVRRTFQRVSRLLNVYIF